MFSFAQTAVKPLFFTQRVREIESADSSVDTAFVYRGLCELSGIVIPLLRLPSSDATADLTNIYIETLLETSTEKALLQWGAPSELSKQVEAFSVAWHETPREKRTLIDIAEKVSIAAQNWKVPQGQQQNNYNRASISAKAFFCVEAFFLVGTIFILYYDNFFNKLGVFSGLMMCFFFSCATKVSIVRTMKRESVNLNFVDNVMLKIGNLLTDKDLFIPPANPLAQSQMSHSALDGSAGQDDEFVGDYTDLQNNKGNTGKGFLLNIEDVGSQKIDIDALIAEADDDDGWMILRLAGHPNVKIQMPALNRHLMIVVTDRSGKVLYWNDGATFVCGFTSLDVTGKPVDTFLYGTKTIETYGRMVEGAARGVELSAKTLSLASNVYGYVPVRASVVPAISEERHVGYVIIASQVEGGSAKSQALLHQFVIHELKEELQEADREAPNAHVSRCRTMMQKLKWSTLQDVAVAARDWRPVQVHAAIAEALRSRLRERTLDLQFKTDVPETAVVDRDQLKELVSDLAQLIPGKAQVELSCRPFTEVLRVLVVSMSPFEEDPGLLQPFNNKLAEICADVSLNGNSIVVAFPYLVDGSSGLSSTQHAENPVGQTTKSEFPMTIILLEQNQIFRHNISSVIWACGHSMRIMDSNSHAMQNIKDTSQNIDCAIIDADARDAESIIKALDSRHVPYVLTTENSSSLGNRRLFKPIDAKVLSANLEDIAKSVHEKKRHEEEVVRQREVFGKVRNSPWTRGKKLGRGAFADVYEATSTLTGGKMAVKMIRSASGVDQEEWMNSLLNEIQILCSLSHPNIIHYFYCESGETTINLFMEIATQGSMQDLLARTQGQGLSEAKTAHMIKELLQAVNYLHNAEITHRDIKPGNILLNDGKVKLSDFGTATNQVAMDTQGTVFYMAPEVIDGQEYGKPCDIWSVGCVVCECCNVKRDACEGGMLGFQAPKSYPSQCSPALIDFISQCMQTDPKDRPTAGSLLLHDFILGSGNASTSGGIGGSVKGPGSVQQWSVDGGHNDQNDDTESKESVASW